MLDQIFGTVDLLIAFTFVCVVMALVVWVRFKSDGKVDSKTGEKGSQVRNDRMAALLAHVGHWAGAAVSMVIGLLLGVAIAGLVGLIFSGAWVAVFNIAVLSAALFAIVWLHERLGDLLLPSPIRPARRPGKVRRTPLARRLSLPAGLVLGVVLAGFGQADRIVGWFS